MESGARERRERENEGEWPGIQEAGDCTVAVDTYICVGAPDLGLLIISFRPRLTGSATKGIMKPRLLLRVVLTARASERWLRENCSNFSNMALPEMMKL